MHIDEKKGVAEARSLRQQKLDSEDALAIKALTKLGDDGGHAMLILERARQGQTPRKRDWMSSILKRLLREGRVRTWLVREADGQARERRWYALVEKS